jgi:hypothetical protein
MNVYYPRFESFFDPLELLDDRDLLDLAVFFHRFFVVSFVGFGHMNIVSLISLTDVKSPQSYFIV